MATAAKSQDLLIPGEEMRVSHFDKVVSMLVALIILVGLFVVVLFCLWLYSRISFPRPEMVVAEIVETPAGRGDNAEGTERDFDPPAAEEVEQLLEPTVQETITAVTDAVASVAEAVEASEATVVGSSKGDSRPPGPEQEGDDIIPRGMRWRLIFSAKNLAGYAEQLDYFEIELGLIGGDIEGVDYAFGFSKSPQKKRGASEKEKRLWFQWTDVGVFTQYDQQLLAKAGLSTTGRNVLMFIPKKLENYLASIELDYAKKKGFQHIKQVAKTVFEVQMGKNGYEFVITDQRYRTPRF